MSERVFNFSAGPAILPEPVLKQAQNDLLDIFDTGIGILEHSHRGKAFDRVLAEAEADCRKVGNIPDNYRVMFLQGGASTQFFQIPANFLPSDRTADYFVTGNWSNKASKEVSYYGNMHIAASSKDKDFSYIPKGNQVNYSDNPVYVHFATNNTIYGTQFKDEPPCPDGAFLIGDTSSDMYCRPIDVSKYGVIYASAQKNLGPSGTALVIVREDLLEKPARELPMMLRYALLAEKESRYNTPPTFGIYLMGQVFKWILNEGGLETIEKLNERKANYLYDAIDAGDFYEGTAQVEDRSTMNVTFRMPSEEITARFIAEAAQHKLSGMKGYRSVGGIRASIYNAFPEEGCQVMAQFMKDFASKNG